MPKPLETSLKFGTSGLRGLATDLLSGGAGRYAAAFCSVLLTRDAVQAGSSVYIAHDNRESSPELLTAVASAITARGLVPVSCRAIPTPALALHAMGQTTPAIMITGSHIPADRNGLKFYRPDGEIDKADELAISAAVETENLPEIASSSPVRNDGGDALGSFENRCLMLSHVDGLSGARIGLYAHTSVAVGVIQSVLKTLGATVVVLGGSEIFVPIDTESIASGTIKQFGIWATEHDLDAIVSTDADADRPLVADEAGAPLRGDLLGLLASAHIRARTIVTPVTSNSGIRHSDTWSVVRTRVGSPYVIEAMGDAELSPPVVGFEANGGTLLQHAVAVPGGTVAALPTRDAMLPIIATLLRARADNIPLSYLRNLYPMPFAHADRLPDYPTKTGTAFVAELSSGLDACTHWLTGLGEVQSLDTTDGARITLANDRIVHFRPSGNAPELRCYSEAETEVAAKDLVSDGLAIAAAYLKRS